MRSGRLRINGRRIFPGQYASSCQFGQFGQTRRTFVRSGRDPIFRRIRNDQTGSGRSRRDRLSFSLFDRGFGSSCRILRIGAPPRIRSAARIFTFFAPAIRRRQIEQISPRLAGRKHSRIPSRRRLHQRHGFGLFAAVSAYRSNQLVGQRRSIFLRSRHH